MALLAAIIRLETVIGDKVGLHVEIRLLQLGQGHGGWWLICTHAGWYAVADIAVKANRFSLVAQVLPIVTAETAGKLVVLVVIGKVLPGHTRFLKDQACDQLLCEQLSLLNLAGHTCSKARMLSFVPLLHRVDCFQSFFLAGIAGRQQVQHLLLGVGQIRTQHAFG